jgi:predicted CoA-binding protein
MVAPLDPAEVHAFLAGRRLAVVGASDSPQNFGRTIYEELRDHGYEVVAVHPTAATVQGDPCHPDLGSVPGTIDGVVVMVPKDRSAEVVRAAIDRGVEHVWLFKGAGGASAVSDEAVALCEEHGVAVVVGACPLMFLEPVGAIHRIHRGFRRMTGSLARPA